MYIYIYNLLKVTQLGEHIMNDFTIRVTEPSAHEHITSGVCTTAVIMSSIVRDP